MTEPTDPHDGTTGPGVTIPPTLTELADAVKEAREDGIESIGTLQLELWLREEAQGNPGWTPGRTSRFMMNEMTPMWEAFLRAAGLPPPA